MRLVIGQTIYRRKWTGLFYFDSKMEKRLPDSIYFFDVSKPFEIKEFKLCKWPCLLVGKHGNLTNCWSYSILDKRNI